MGAADVFVAIWAASANHSDIGGWRRRLRDIASASYMHDAHD